MYQDLSWKVAFYREPFFAFSWESGDVFYLPHRLLSFLNATPLSTCETDVCYGQPIHIMNNCYWNSTSSVYKGAAAFVLGLYSCMIQTPANIMYFHYEKINFSIRWEVRRMPGILDWCSLPWLVVCSQVWICHTFRHVSIVKRHLFQIKWLPKKRNTWLS